MHSRARCARRALALLSAHLIACPGLAAEPGLVVVHDSGRTVPIAQYLAAFTADDPTASAEATPPTQVELPLMLPVRTPSMRPGLLGAPLAWRHPPWLITPVFLIGDDPRSRAWLGTHRARLAHARASGIVVDVESLTAFRALQQLAPELPMVPASFDDLARQIGLSVYPVYLPPQGAITQEPR
jgi:integrating conjugative element protein (TIGR03765 family)